MILLLGLLSVLWGEPGLCLERDGVFTFDGDIRQFAVGSNSVYIATEERLYQLSHDLTLINSLTQRGILNTGNQQDDVQFHRVSETAAWNSTFSINVLLPFTKSDSLISCGVTDNDCGYCEILDLKNISNLLHSEHIQVGPLKRSSASVSFLVDVKKKKTQTDTYILTAIQQNKEQPENSRCGINHQTINLHNTDDKQGGGIFSLTDGASSTPGIQSKGDVEFVDGFQINSTIYLFSNALSDHTNRVRLIWFHGEKSKTDALKSLRGATLSTSDGESSRLVASSVIPGEQPVLWSGVFSVDGGDTNTELIVFDISAYYSRETDKDPDFYTSAPSSVTPKSLKPKAVLLRSSYMTSVLAVRQRSWMVFFIGTGDGQIIKLAVDKNYHSACPTVLYGTNNKVFHKLHLDPVDHKHVYVPFRNQMKRVPVSKCSTYTNVPECWSAQDPYCVWCGSKRSCTFEGDCMDSDWLSIPDDSQRNMIAHKVEKDTNGQISLIIHTHLTVGQEAASNFSCHFSATSSQMCSRNNPPPQFPQCTCVLNGTVPPDGLNISVKFRLGTTELSERLRLTSCSDISGPPTSVLCQQCIEAGCGWNKTKCSWANQGETNDSVCRKLESGTNFSIPEISSITPSVVSSYGRNHAVLSGSNLSDVTAVRIWALTDCTPKESPVWKNTGASLTFHIPSSDIKHVASVCVLLPDGSCHSEAKITYRSSPSCSNIIPSSSWISGKRKITLIGRHLEFVEGVLHSHAMQDVRLPRDISAQTLIYDTPAAENTSKISSSTVFLKVANQTLACSTKLSLYPDPEFTSFTATRTGEDVRITIQKKADKLEMSKEELSVWGVQGSKTYQCIMEAKETSNDTDSFTCEIKSPPNHEFQLLLVKFGERTVSLEPQSLLHSVLQMVRFMLIPCVIAALVIIYFWQKRLAAEKNDL